MCEISLFAQMFWPYHQVVIRAWKFAQLIRVCLCVCLAINISHLSTQNELHRVRTIYRSAPSKFGSLVLTALCANICFSQIYGHTCAPSITMSWTCAEFRLWAEPIVNPIKIAFADIHTHIDFGHNSVPINGIDHRSQLSTAEHVAENVCNCIRI